MPLSRLENFLKNAEGNILYVNPSDFDATDSFENQGNSLTRPFKSIQRALIEAARFSYQAGDNNDKIDRTTILVYPGTHYIDNRPGYSIEEINGQAVYKEQVAPGEWVERTLPEFGENTNFDILDPANDLRKYNATAGGTVLPRGTSIIGLDLRKTKIRPLYVPDPEDDSVTESSIFNVTGTCYFTAFTIFDGDPSKTVYKNYSESRVVPNFSHHKLTTFAYADGVSKVTLGNYQTYLTDLDMYYYKVAKAYGDITGRGLVDFPVGTDFEPSIDEFRIVGALEANPLGISSIRAGNGDGTGDLNIITVTTADRLTGSTAPHNLFVDSPFLLNGVEVDQDSYNGSFTVKEVVGINTFTFTTNQSPLEVLPAVAEFDTATVASGSDTVSSASPYIFNVSLRSVFGLCGMHADGNKANGFKSMVVAQFTGVSLQKDDNAFLLYDEGVFYDENTLPENSPQRPLHTNSRAIFKPDYENAHIRASNNSFIQAVSIFAIGFSHHFLTESGGDMSITNSNSNFGNTSLESTGFKPEAFNRDDTGYITHIIPPKEVVTSDNPITWLSLDALKIINSTDASKLYVSGANNEEIPPAFQVDGYRIGARDDDRLNLTITIGTAQTNYSSPILMPVSGGSGVSARKLYEVVRSNGENDIVNDTISLTSTHQFINGEKLRVFSDTGQVPDGLENEGIYYAITTGVGGNQVKLAQSVNDALANQPILGISNNGGVISLVSRVSDKLPGDLGHPIQFDSTEGCWYLQSSPNGVQNEIYSAIVGIGTALLGTETSSSYIERKLDNRSIDDKIYKVRYVIPKEYTNAKPPEAGYVIQESGNVGVTSISFTNDVLSDSTELRNEKVVTDASAGPIISNAQVVTLTTELPHGLSAGDTVNIDNVRSTNNPLSVGITSSYNGVYTVESVISSKQFQYTIAGVSTNPGSFSNDIDQRATRQQREALPTFSRQAYDNTFYIYRVAQVKRHIPGADGQDGIYHLICLQSNVAPSSGAGFNLDQKEYNQDVINLYPQLDRDNLNTNPKASTSYASLKVLGSVITNDRRNSITREALDYFTRNSEVGIAITTIGLSGSNNSVISVGTEVEHGFNKIKTVTFTAGAGYTPSQIFYSKVLSPVSASGQGASVRATSNSSGEIIDVQLVDPGSAYGVGDTLEIPGGTTNSVVTVASIIDNSNSAIEIQGYNLTSFNDVYKITNVTGPKSLTLEAPLGISTFALNTTGERGYLIPSNDVVGFTSAFLTDPTTGITTVTTSSSHGLLPGNAIKIVNSTSFDGDAVVEEVVGLSTFTFVSLGSTAYTDASSGQVLRKTIAPNALNLGAGEENLGSRGSTFYDGLTLTTDQAFDNLSATISFSDATAVVRGDYFTIGSEIIRIASASNPFDVLRGQFGTVKTNAKIGSIVRRIKVLPAEVRRPSFMRASGHTFEYLGFGPGNYSTGMPQKQDRILSSEEIIVSQSKEQRGGQVVYTGMNDLGEFFSGSKKLSSATGEETVIDAPILTYTGDDSQGESSAVSSGIFDELLVRQRLTVEGGENNNQSSQFYGPVNFTQKVTNLSDFGIETKDLFIKGTAPQSKLITVGISTPTSSSIKTPRVGDIQFLSNPSENYIGHVRVGNEWRKWGLVSREDDELDIRVDKLHVNTTGTPSQFKFDVDGNSRVENLVVGGSIVFQQPQSLGNVTFQDIVVQRTARFTATGVDPVTGLSSNYTQIHSSGISELADLDVTGISTFAGQVDFNSNIFGVGAKFGNIRIAITDDNTIDTSSGDIILNADSGLTRIIDNLIVDGDKIELNKGDATSIGGTITSRNDGREFQLGMGSTDGASKMVLHANDRTSGLSKVGNTDAEGSLTIERLADDKFTNTVGDSVISHKGKSDIIINAIDAESNISVRTNNTQRVHVGYSGTVRIENSNDLDTLKGTHLSLVQSGDGDSVISFVHNKNNINQRWYAGVDADDGYTWKLARPEPQLQFNSEDWNNSGETKLSVTSNGNTVIAGELRIGGSVIDSSTSGILSLFGTPVQAHVLHSAHTISLGSDSNTSFLSLRGTKEAVSTNTGALTVAGGVGIVGNLYVGGHMNDTEIIGTLSATGNVDFGSGKFTLNTSTGDGVFGGKVTAGGDLSVTGNISATGGLDIEANSDINGDLNAIKFIKKFPTNNDGTNFLRADGSDTNLTEQDYIDSLGFVPGPPITISSYPIGNSIILDSIDQQFDDQKVEFLLTRNGGTAFIPVGPVNLLVSLGGVIQEANKDYFVSTDPSTGDFTNKIRFISAPPAGMNCYIIALGGQGALLSDPAWENKGEIAVGLKDNQAQMLQVGSDDQVLTADSSVALGMRFKDLPPGVLTGSIFYFPSSSIPAGYQICNGGAAQTQALRNIVGNNVPNMMNRFVLSGSSITTGGQDSVSLTTTQLPPHTHSLGANGNHGHGGSTGAQGNHGHGGSVPHSSGHVHSVGHGGHHNHRVGDNGHQHSFVEEGFQDGAKYSGQGEEGFKGGDRGRNTRTGHASIYCDGAGNHNHNIGHGEHSHPLSINSGGNHAHNISINNAGSHSHTIGSAGSGNAFDIRPSYITLIPIIKT
tara:strand:- start:3145 stop:10818 length:7674 start_codon:yes stop_codon:yes gene_type:complete